MVIKHTQRQEGDGGVTWAERSRQRKSQCKGPGAETQQSISWRGQCDGARVRGRVGMKIEK